MITERQAGLFHVRDDDPFGADPDEAISDHADAAAQMLLAVVRKLRARVSPEDLGRDVVLIGRMMERKI